MFPAEANTHRRFLCLFTTHEEAVCAFVRRLAPGSDEQLLLGRAMNDAEISALFGAGNPYR